MTNRRGFVADDNNPNFPLEASWRCSNSIQQILSPIGKDNTAGGYANVLNLPATQGRKLTAKGWGDGIRTTNQEVFARHITKHPLTDKLNSIKGLYDKAIIVEQRKRGHSESSRIKSRWWNDLAVIEEALRKDMELPDNLDKALDKVHDELLGYVESAGEYYESVDSYVCLETMVDVILHPAK